MTASPSSPKPFYVKGDDGAFHPNRNAGSPWLSGHQNGLALGGLFAQALMQAPPPEGMNIARFTLDILRPAPMAPTVASWTRLRDGRRTSAMTGRLVAGGVETAVASALFVRKPEDGVPGTPSPIPAILPEDAPDEFMLPLKTGLEARLIRRGAAHDLTTGACWVRSLSRLDADTPLHPIVAVVMACDFGVGLSSGLDRQAWSSPSLDLAIHFIRSPRDEWTLIEADTLMPGNGAALVDMRLSDRFGLFGRANLTMAVFPGGAHAQ
ncbi:MAG: thioesterase family protein [Caulobacteraceae bacterium]|nr:thioesterase family protein [Caulobacteraceae bacterium]